MKALLKALGIGREFGTEAEAQKLWVDALGDLGYNPQQAFPDNMTNGTDRLAGDPVIQRKTSVIHHLFRPTFETKTYYDLDSGIPLYSRTKGVLGNPELVLWAGIIGMGDVLGNRFPQSDDDKKTEIYRRGHPALGGKKQKPIMIEASKILSREGQPFTGKKPDSLRQNFNTLDEQEEWLETNYPEYHRWLVENLHMPIEAQSNLDKLGVTKDRADLLRKVTEITPKGLIETVINDAVKEDNNKWQIVLMANSAMKAKVKDKGFINLFANDYYRTLMDSDEVSDYIKLAIEKINSKEGRVTGKYSEYFIRAPEGKTIQPKVSKWINKLKRSETMFDDIKKKEGSDWKDVVKEDKKDKKPKTVNPDEKGTLSERTGKDLYTGDWEVEGGLDRHTAMPKDATKIQRDKGGASTDTNCCLRIKNYMLDYISLEHPRIFQMFDESGVKRIINEQLTCRDIEEKFVTEGAYYQSTGESARRTGEVKTSKGNVLWEGRLPSEEIVINFEGETTPKGKLFRMGGQGIVSFDIHEPAPFREYAGQKSFNPKKAFAEMKFTRNTRGYDTSPQGYAQPMGLNLSMVDLFLQCKTGELGSPGSKKIRLRTGDDGSNLEMYEDIGMDTKVSRKVKEMVINTWVRSYGKNPTQIKRGKLNDADLKQMKTEWPEGHAMYTGKSQISDKGNITSREMNINERMRESFWDDEDEILRFIHNEKMKKLYPGEKFRWPNPPKVNRGHSNMDVHPDPKLSRSGRGWGLEDYDTEGRTRMIIWTKIPAAGEETDVYDRIQRMLDGLDARSMVTIKDVSELKDSDPTHKEIEKVGSFPVLQHGTTVISKDIGKYIEDRI